MLQVRRDDVQSSSAGAAQGTARLTRNQEIVYEALCQAADAGEPCPLNLDLEMLLGCNSGSVAPITVKRLELAGLIRVIRFQRFRRVQICATGKWTLTPPNQKTTNRHVPRGHGRGLPRPSRAQSHGK